MEGREGRGGEGRGGSKGKKERVERMRWRRGREEVWGGEWKRGNRRDERGRRKARK